MLRDTIADVEPLDNPVWHALTGPHARFAQGTGLALRYEPEVSAFAALPDDPPREAWDALGDLVGRAGAAVLFRLGRFELPREWEIAMALPTLQMVTSGPIGRADPEFAPLGTGDVADMLDLVERTKPGPFFARTHELGTYLGGRDGRGELVAMAGERLRFAGYTEVSAVCTDPNARKRGLATRLVRAVAAGIDARGETTMLHVLADNDSAIRVYESLGFAVRAAFDVIIVRPSGR
jgi:GNAT superfamily N-acetyltransferase